MPATHHSPDSTSTSADLAARMAPTTEQIAAVAATGRRGIVPITFPGKSYGVWTIGQPVEHPHGVYDAEGDDAYRTARDAALDAAEADLAGRRGTVGFVVVYPDGGWAVFEMPGGDPFHLGHRPGGA